MSGGYNTKAGPLLRRNPGSATETCVYFHVYKVAIQTTSRSLVATIITYILTANGDFLSSVKAQRPEGWNLIRFLSAANQNVDQHNDVGTLCLIGYFVQP